MLVGLEYGVKEAANCLFKVFLLFSLASNTELHLLIAGLQQLLVLLLLSQPKQLLVEGSEYFANTSIPAV